MQTPGAAPAPLRIEVVYSPGPDRIDLRALLAEPDVLLLDEPFAKLDAVLREQFRSFVFERIARLAIPALLVTHDPDDVPAGGRVIEISEFSEFNERSIGEVRGA